jgi:glycosyltransferase involved in cell wall biosynthesis
MRRLGLRESDVRILDASDDVRSLFAAADIFVSPSRAEG